MKDARETRAQQGGRNNTGRKGARVRTTPEQSAAAELNVDFIEEPRWELETAAGPVSAKTHYRVLSLSKCGGIAPQESPIETRLARKMAWAILRAQAAANCLGLV